MRSFISCRRSSLLFSLSLLLLLLCLQCSPSLGAPAKRGAAKLFDAKVVPVLTPAALRERLEQEHRALLVAFVYPTHGVSRSMAPQFVRLARNVAAYVQAVAVDCAKDSDPCDEHGVEEGKGAGVRLFVNGKGAAFKSNLRHANQRDLAEWLWGQAWPNHVQQLTPKSEKQSPRDKNKARLILFTEKRDTTPLYKTLALHMQEHGDKLEVAEVRKGQKKLLAKYGIGKNFPVLLMELPVKDGEEEPTPRRYDGKMDLELLSQFALSFIDTATPAVSLPELVDQSCVERHCGGNSLCVVMFLSKEHPDLKRNLARLSAIETAVRSSKTLSGAGRFRFVWSDIVVSEPHMQFAARNFELQPADYPQLVLLAKRKERFAPYIGAFAAEAVLEFLAAVGKGRIGTVPLATPDGKLHPLPEGEACPPEPTKEPKPTESAAAADAAAAAAASKEEEVAELDAHNFDEETINVPRPWLLLFHRAAADSEQNSAVSHEFVRVAKNMGGAVRFGSVDLASQAQLAEKVGVAADNVPAIFALPSRSAAVNLESLQPYTGNLSAARDVRAFAQTFLQTGTVSVVTAQSMGPFMGELQPNSPFPPRFLLFAKPTPSGEVAVPDFLRALSLEFSPAGFAFGVVSSRERNLARQFNVTRIPSAFMLMQQDTLDSGKNEIRVGANPYGGPLTFNDLHPFCEHTLRQYNMQKLQWLSRAPPSATAGGDDQKPAGASGGKKPAGSNKARAAPAHDEEEAVDLDALAHDEL